MAKKTMTRTDVRNGFVSSAVTIIGALYFFFSAINERMMLFDDMYIDHGSLLFLYSLAAFFFTASAILFTKSMKGLEALEKRDEAHAEATQMK